MELPLNANLRHLSLSKVWTIIYFWKSRMSTFQHNLKRAIWSSVAPENLFRVQGGQIPTTSVVLCQPPSQSFAQVPQFQPENT